MADARDVLRSYLAYLGLPAEEGWVLDQIIQGRSEDAIKLDLVRRPAFQARFPDYQAHVDRGQAMTVDEMIAYEKAVGGMMHQYGMPGYMYDSPDDFAAWRGGQVSIAEMQQRLEKARAGWLTAPPEEKAYLERTYGLDDAGGTAFWFDPDRALPHLERAVGESLAAGAATRSGFGQLDQPQAGRIAELGVSREQAEQGFAGLARDRDLFQTQAGEDAIDVDSQISATFAGDAQARARIEQRRRRRAGDYEQGGGFTATQTGLTGVG